MTDKNKNIVFLCLGFLGMGASVVGVMIRSDMLASGFFVGVISLVFICSSLWGLVEKDCRTGISE